MKKLILVVVIIVVIFAIYFATKSNEGDTLNQEVEKTTDEKMMEVAFDYEGVLIDVTDGNDVRGINTEGKASGVSRAVYKEGEYLMLATFENLPDPAGDDFYEGWIVRPSPFKFISTGELEKNDGVYTNTYTSKDDLTDFSRYVLTLEPNDGDPAPADHIVEGDMVRK